MSVRRGGLGRGLGALIPTGPDDAATELSGTRLADVPVAAVSPNPRQPREAFDEDTLDELAASIREVGVLQPIVVREVDPGVYQLVMGERRLRACQRAGLDRIPAIVRDTADTALLRDALLENLHRQQLNPLEEAAAYQQLLEDFETTHEDLASRVGRSRSQVSNTLRLLNLPPSVQRRVAAGVLSAGHARALLSLDDPAEQERMAARVVAEGLSVRAVEEAVAVGDTARSPRQPRRAVPRLGLDELAGRLSDHFDTRVKVEVGRSKGRVVVEFGSVEDLERILTTMAPGTLDALPGDRGAAMIQDPRGRPARG